MKQIIVLINLVFLYTTLSNAQKTISKEDFDHLVDYANCKYVLVFIEKNDAGKQYFEDTYKKKVKPELEKVSLVNFETILNYKKLEELLTKNIPASQLAEKINDRKVKYEEFQDNESLINSLGTTGWKDVDLIKVAANIQNEILTKYNSTNNNKSNKISENEIVKTQTIQTSRQVEELHSKLDQLQEQYENLKNDKKNIEYQKSFEKFRFIVFSVMGLLFFTIIAVFLFLYKSNSREYIIKQVLGSDRIAEKFTLDKNKLVNFIKPYNLTEKDINAIADRVLKCKLLSENEIQQHLKTMVKENFEPSKTDAKYLKGKSGKIFNRLENTSENSFFKLINESNDTAQFEFCGDEAEAIAKRIFSEDICNIVSGSYQNANSVKTDKPGRIKRVGEQWEVIEPVEIKLF